MEIEGRQGEKGAAAGRNGQTREQAHLTTAGIIEDKKATPTDNIFLTVVIPAYNEQVRLSDTLNKVIGWLETQPFASEVLVVDDGSEDATPRIVKDYIARRNGPGRPEGETLCALRLVENEHRGKGFAVRTGMLAGAGQYILFSDADLSTPIADATRLLTWLERGYDVAIGSREGKEARRYNEPAYRHFMGRVFNLLVRLITFSPFQDTQCGFKAFTRLAARDIFQRVQLYGENSRKVRGAMVTGFDVEVLFLAGKLGYKVKEVPVEWYHVEGSKVSPVRDSVRNALDVLKVRLNDLRGLYKK